MLQRGLFDNIVYARGKDQSQILSYGSQVSVVVHGHNRGKRTSGWPVGKIKSSGTPELQALLSSPSPFSRVGVGMAEYSVIDRACTCGRGRVIGPLAMISRSDVAMIRSLH